MIRVNSTVNINTAALRNLAASQVKALEQTGEALHTEVVQAQVIPRDTGAMQGEKTFVDYHKANSGCVTIATEGPYARRMYYHPEYNFSKDKNPNAKGEWFEDYLPGGNKQNLARDMFKQFYKKESGV